MRLFIAIKLSESMRDALIDAQNAMYDHGVSGNYTSEENMHLTLAFIGEYPDAAPVLDALDTVTFSPFDLQLDRMGCFGDLWWAGMADCPPLMAVVRRIHRALAEHDIPFDRKRFSPHITLIRHPVFILEESVPPVPAVSMEVNHASLMRSDRGKNGMIYTEIG